MCGRWDEKATERICLHIFCGDKKCEKIFENFRSIVDKRRRILYNNGKSKKGEIVVSEEKKKRRDIIEIIVIIVLCAIMAVLDFLPIKYTSDEVKNGLISDTVPLIIGTVAVIWLMIRGKTGLFGRPTKLWFLIPCLLVAVDNFPFPSYFAGKSQLLYTDVDKWLWFAGFCIFVGVFEECVFRGIVFPLLAGCFSSDKKGLIKTFFISSVIFGGMHLFNIFAGAGIGPTLLQAGYSTLIGGLCAFALMKTKNILFPAFVHGLYDFCGLMLPKLGSGAIFDTPTVILMAVVGISVGIFVLYSVWRYPEEERIELYKRLGFGIKVLPEQKKDKETI